MSERIRVEATGDRHQNAPAAEAECIHSALRLADQHAAILVRRRRAGPGVCWRGRSGPSRREADRGQTRRDETRGVVPPRTASARFRSVGSLKSIRGEQAQPIADALRVIRHAAHVVDQLVPEDGRNPEFILDAE